MTTKTQDIPPLPFCPMPPELAYESVAAIDATVFKQGLLVPVPEQLIRTPWIWLVSEAFLFALFIVSERSYAHYYEQYIALIRQVYTSYIKSESEFHFVAPTLPSLKPPYTSRSTRQVKTHYRFLSFKDGFHRKCLEADCECAISTPFFCVCDGDVKAVLHSLCACASLDKNGNFYYTLFGNNILAVWSYVCNFYDEAEHERVLEAIGIAPICLCPTTMRTLCKREVEDSDVQLISLGDNTWTSSIFPGALSHLNIVDWAQRAAETRIEKLKQAITQHASFDSYVKTTQTTLLYDIAKRFIVPHLVLPQTSRVNSAQITTAAEATIINSPPLLVSFLASLESPGKVVEESNTESRRLRLNGHIRIYPATQFWQDFKPKENNKGRGLLSLTMYVRSCDAEVAADYIATFLTAPPVVAPLPSARPPPDPQSLLTAATRLNFGSPGSLYLRGQRGLSDADSALLEGNGSILETSNLWYYSTDTGKSKRTHTLLFVGPGGLYLQRVYISADGKKQTDTKCPKQSLGTVVHDGCTEGIILRRGTDGVCFVTEGPETGLSVAVAMPQSSVVCTLGASNVASLRPPAGTTSVVVCRENDKPTTQVGIEVLLKKFRSKLQCHYAEVWPTSELKDFNDYHQRKPGSAGTREICDTITLQLARARLAKRPLENGAEPAKRQAIEAV